jgi:hypothetical protein
VILIYTPHITTRVLYAMDIVFKTVLQTDYKLTDHKEEFIGYNKCKIAYTKVNEDFPVFIKSNDILFETDINAKTIEVDNEYLDFPKFFKSNTQDFLGYDVFAMVFYFATRYEEYLKSDLDEHQRFQAEKSLAFQNNCLQIPFLNVAIQQFGDKLKQHFPFLKFNKPTF